MRKSAWLFAAALAFCVALPVSADVVLHFTNGTTMPVRGYRFDGDMVHVDLGGNGQIAFPSALVDRVEDPQRSLNLKAGRVPGQNRRTMTAGSAAAPGATTASNGAAVTPPRPTGSTGRGIQTDSHGMAVSNAIPRANSSAATRLKNFMLPDDAAARNANANADGNMRGAVRSGNRWVMAGEAAPVRPQGIGITLGDRVKPANFNAPPQPDGDSGAPVGGGSDE